MRADKELKNLLDETVAKGTDDAYYMLEAKRDADLDYLSKADYDYYIDVTTRVTKKLAEVA